MNTKGDQEQPATVVMNNVAVPMRDGVTLATTVFLPAGQGSFPVVLVRSAYGRMMPYPATFKEQGIAYVVQDCRGRYGSQGEFYPFSAEAQDGYDTLQWLGAQPWCNGEVGMFGDSYLAGTQLLAAPTQSPYLKVLNPRFMAGDCWKRAYYCDGAFSLALTWSWLCFECASRTSEAALMPYADVPQLLRHLPLVTLDEASGAGQVRSYRDFVTHNTYDQLWEQNHYRAKMDQFNMPVLLTGGWYDYYAGETFANYKALCEAPTSDQLRRSHRVIVGPWTHGINPKTQLGDMDFGEAALQENDSTNRWLSCMLKGGNAQDFQRAPIRIFVMGINRWRDEYEWPLARTAYTPYYLHADGRLDAVAPTVEPPDTYTYDPADPAPTLGGNHSVGPYNPGLYEHCMPGPIDQRPLQARADVLCYTTDPLPQDTEITGPVVVQLHISSTAVDTDFVAKLIDVYPDGRAINITEGALRMRFRNGVHGQPQLMEPGAVYPCTVDLQATSNVFRAGHRIRVLITSSNFPLLDRNLNTGNDPATDTQMVVAHQTIYHDEQRPSHILLPVIAG